MNFDRDYAMLIGGKLEGGSARFAVLNPATEQVIGNAPDAGQADLDRLLASGPLPPGGGVGLRLVHDLVSGLGGEIQHKRKDARTHVRVTLPMKDISDA